MMSQYHRWPDVTNIPESGNSRTKHPDIPGYTGTLNATREPYPTRRHRGRSQKPPIQERNGHTGAVHSTATLSEAVCEGLPASPVLVMSGPGPYPRLAGEHATQGAFDPSARGSTTGMYRSGRKRILSRRFPGADLSATAAGDQVLCETSKMMLAAQEADEKPCFSATVKELCLSLVGSTYRKMRQPKTDERAGNRLLRRITSDCRKQCSLSSFIEDKADTLIGTCRRTKSCTPCSYTQDGAMPLPRESLPCVIPQEAGDLCQNRRDVKYVPSQPMQDTWVKIVEAVRGFPSTFLEGMRAFLLWGRVLTSDVKFQDLCQGISFFYSTNVSTK